ncbi:helix-turn-helix domain-containing protein [Fodinicola acaciae]|uniref:helix-turn-helix domain-containing protein n=1 Tax=Fodinicola acaciae TaxID=2681555 RepID=UPI001FE53C50|nr:helix-turn-helix domain-containing protein [Fodinicola acaciae]
MADPDCADWRASGAEVRRSRILLELDEGVGETPGEPPSRRAVAEKVGVDPQTITNVARAYVEHDGDVGATIRRKRRSTPPVEPIVTGEVEARLIALGCSTPPEGRSRWTLRLLEKHIALMRDMPNLDHSTIGKVVKKRRFVLT